jgi:hypothetical protein
MPRITLSRQQIQPTLCHVDSWCESQRCHLSAAEEPLVKAPTTHDEICWNSLLVPVSALLQLNSAHSTLLYTHTAQRTRKEAKSGSVCMQELLLLATDTMPI